MEFVALPVAVFAAFLFRAASFGTSMGPDELSLLVMARSILDGAFPYEVYWDVRAPLAYFIALPPALLGDAFAALATLRLLIVFVHAGAAWTFFCLFRRTCGAPAAAMGAVVLLVSVNTSDVTMMAMPNHFVMGMSLAAFACLVAGIRGRGPCLFLSALLAGTVPWVMVQSGLVTLGLAALVMFGDSPLRRIDRFRWVLLAALPSVVIVGAFLLWGPFDVFFRTVFLAPFGLIEARVGMDWSTRLAQLRGDLPGSILWRVVYVSVIAAGAAWFRTAARRAPSGSPLRYAAFLVMPVSAGFIAIFSIRPLSSLEYFIEVAPVAGLFTAIAASRLWHSRLWDKLLVSGRVCPAALRTAAVACLGAVLALPSNPYRGTEGVAEKEPLPPAYCDSAARWVESLAAGRTVLDLSGICGLRILDTGKPFHPPFTYAGNWFRPGTSWIGDAVSGDGSEAAAVGRLRDALSRGSAASVIVANGLLLAAVEKRGWTAFFHDEWRLVWYRPVPGHDAGFDHLAVFVRADMLDEA